MLDGLLRAGGSVRDAPWELELDDEDRPIVTQEDLNSQALLRQVFDAVKPLKDAPKGVV